jgi:F-type H+-transporting ATPase subunit delta
MYIGVVSTRYAKALLALANESAHGPQVYAEALRLKVCFDRVMNLRLAMENPVLGADAKLDLIRQAAGGQLSEEWTRFVRLVCNHKREKYLLFMVNSFITLYRRQQNINEGRLTTAVEVSPAVLDKLREGVERHTGGTAEFESHVDPRLEGGFIFEVGTYRLDASVANQMRRIKRQFIEKNRRIV